MPNANEYLERVVLGNSLWVWFTAGLTATLVFVAAVVVRAFVRRHYQRMLATEKLELMELPFEVASRTTLLFMLAGAVFAGLGFLSLPAKASQAISVVFTVAGFTQLGMWGSTAVQAWLMLRRKRALETDLAAAGSIGIIGVVLRTLVWALVLLLTLDNLGVDITALVAGLGVGGIAVALALQNVLGDLFASLSITLDRPFVLGDFVIIGECMGNVEHIGLKSTRLRSLGGEQIIVANADLLSSRIRNYKRMEQRRIVFSIGVTYETPREKLQSIPQTIREIVERQKMTRFDRCHFAKYGDFALTFETVYHVLSGDYNQYMDVQQTINFELHEAFERARIEFAYPTQKLWMAAVAPDAAAEPAQGSRAGHGT